MRRGQADVWFKNNSLFVLLPACILIGILAMVREITMGHQLYHSEGPVAGTVAHGPAEFPAVFSFDPLEGLKAGGGEIQVAPPPISKEYWPCAQCHDADSSNPKRRELKDEHTNIVLRHGDETRWCLDCHDFADRNKLHLASGEKISFDESYRLCGQCHGPTYRDWRLGIHGKRTGYWNGPKRYLLCVSCHWPHEPHFKSLQPLPPPVRPEFLRTAPSGEVPPPPPASPPAPTGAPSAPAPPAAIAAPTSVPTVAASPAATPGEKK